MKKAIAVTLGITMAFGVQALPGSVIGDKLTDDSILDLTSGDLKNTKNVATNALKAW